jgi:hypothetical protein
MGGIGSIRNKKTKTNGKEDNIRRRGSKQLLKEVGG